MTITMIIKVRSVLDRPSYMKNINGAEIAIPLLYPLSIAKDQQGRFKALFCSPDFDENGLQIYNINIG